MGLADYPEPNLRLAEISLEQDVGENSDAHTSDDLPRFTTPLFNG